MRNRAVERSKCRTRSKLIMMAVGMIIVLLVVAILAAFMDSSSEKDDRVYAGECSNLTSHLNSFKIHLKQNTETSLSTARTAKFRT